MDVVVTSAGMQACDRRAMDRYAVPSALLMENAGSAVAAAVAGELRRAGGGGAVVVCGPGNNGGDGFVAARHLLGAGIAVRVVLVGRPARLKGDPLVNFTILKKLSKDPAIAKHLDIVVDPEGRKPGGMERLPVIVDALFGTGFHGALKGPYLRAVEWMNRQGSSRIAVDVPSGLDADNGRVGNACVRAEMTVTMGLLKAGLLTGLGPSVCGRVVVAGLGLPTSAGKWAGPATYRVAEEDARQALPSRPFTAHKHSVGKVLVLAGSVGFTGAAALCASAAMRTGAGAVILAAPKSVFPILARKLTEVMVKPLPESAEGTFCEESLAGVAGELDWADIVIAGPGVGRGAGAAAFSENLLKMRGKRLMLDADVLNYISADSSLAGILRRNSCILTPHTGEFSRLTGLKADAIEMDRIEAARRYAVRHRITLVLKGAPTVTAGEDGTAYVNSTGNPGMASAGMGDVLAGVIGAIWAGVDDPVRAAWAGVCIHGMAGDNVAARLGHRSLMAGDVLNELSKVIES